jgi:hypothetical protein
MPRAGTGRVPNDSDANIQPLRTCFMNEITMGLALKPLSRKHLAIPATAPMMTPPMIAVQHWQRIKY